MCIKPQRGAVYVGPRAVNVKPPNTYQPSFGPIVRVIVEAVIFADGEFVGTDRFRRFDHMAMQVKAEGDLGRELAAVRHDPSRYEAVWAHILTLAQSFDATKFEPRSKTALDVFANLP